MLKKKNTERNRKALAGKKYSGLGFTRKDQNSGAAYHENPTGIYFFRHPGTNFVDFVLFYMGLYGSPNNIFCLIRKHIRLIVDPFIAEDWASRDFRRNVP